MARAALGWSLDDLAESSGVSRRTIAKFEAGGSILPDNVEAMRRAMEAAGCRFLMNGPHKGAVVPPAAKPIEDKSGGNPLMPR